MNTDSLALYCSVCYQPLKSDESVTCQYCTIRDHLRAGNEVTLVTCTRVTVMDIRHIDYIRQDADGKGFRLGWPGKKSVYAFANQLKLVPPGMTMKGGRK